MVFYDMDRTVVRSIAFLLLTVYSGVLLAARDWSDFCVANTKRPFELNAFYDNVDAFGVVYHGWQCCDYFLRLLRKLMVAACNSYAIKSAHNQSSPTWKFPAQEVGKPKMARQASPASLRPPPAEVEVTAVGDDTANDARPPDELDEMDAAEAAQFKADVQGHRYHDVGLACKPSASKSSVCVVARLL